MASSDQQEAGTVYQGARALTANEVADAVWWTVTHPAHVNINTGEFVPVTQSFGALPVHRQN